MNNDYTLYTDRYQTQLTNTSYAQIPDEKFPVLLEYLEGLRGGARETTVQKALALVEESGKAPEDVSVQQRAQRAREVIQLLSWPTTTGSYHTQQKKTELMLMSGLTWPDLTSG